MKSYFQTSCICPDIQIILVSINFFASDIQLLVRSMPLKDMISLLKILAGVFLKVPNRPSSEISALKI